MAEDQEPDAAPKKKAKKAAVTTAANGADPHAEKTAEKLERAEEAVMTAPAPTEEQSAPAAKKASAKSAAEKSSTTKAVPAQKPPAKKSSARESPEKKAPAQKPPEKKAPAQKEPAQKAAAQSSSAQKPPAKKPPAPKAAEKTSEKPARTKRASRPTPSFADLRNRVAQVVKIVTALAAIVLAVGALLVALRSNINETNSLVRFITDLADAIDGPFSRDSGIFTFAGKNALTKEALVNWGIAAIAWLVVGRVLDVVIRPRGRS